MVKSFKTYYRSISKIYALFFLMGIVTGLLFYFKTEDTYEKNLFNTLAESVNQRISTQSDNKSKLLASLHLVNSSLEPRQKAFGNSNLKGFKAGILQPLTVDLMTAQGACGSYALVMARLMEDVGFKARMVQMKANGIYGEHNITEVKVDGSWVVVDPLYDLYFRKPDGNLAPLLMCKIIGIIIKNRFLQGIT